MNKAKWLRVVNVILFVCVLNQLITALMSEFIKKEIFEALHPGGGVALVLVGAVHIALNWSWVKANYSK